MSFGNFLGLLGTLVSIALWFLIPILCWVLYLRVAKTVRVVQDNQDKLNVIDKRLERIEIHLNSMQQQDNKLL